MVAQGFKDTVAFKNGIEISPEPFSERAFVYADGVFETMLVVKGKIPLWDYHKARLIRAASVLKLNIVFELLEKQINTILSVSSCARYMCKLIVGRSGISRASYSELNSTCDYWVLLKPFSSKYKDIKASLKIVPQPLVINPAYAGLKLINRMDYVVPTVNEEYASDIEALFLNPAGQVIETMHHNIFVCDGDTMLTPDLSELGVQGVMRDVLIKEILPSLGFKVTVQNLNLEMLKRADAVYITNALDGVVECAYLGEEKLKESQKISQIKAALIDYE